MIYSFKATFDALKGFMRQYDLRHSDTLYDFHKHIVENLSFAPDQMAIFRSLDAKGKTCKQYGLFDLGNGAMDEVTIEELINRKESQLLYVFDVRDERFLRLTFLHSGEELPRKSYPRTSEEQGLPLSQFADKQQGIDYDNDIMDGVVDTSEINNVE